MTIIYDSRCAEYQQEGHPEAPFRVEESFVYLQKRYSDWNWHKPSLAHEKDLSLV